MVLWDELLNRPEYVLAGLGALIATVKWLLYKQQKNEEKKRAEHKAYVDGEVEKIQKGYEKRIDETNASLHHLEEKLDIILVDMKDDISELHVQCFGNKVPKSFRKYRQGGILRSENNTGIVDNNTENKQ